MSTKDDGMNTYCFTLPTHRSRRDLSAPEERRLR